MRPQMDNMNRVAGSTINRFAVHRSWALFLAWSFVGLAFAMVFLGAFSIGIFFVPIVIISSILLARRPDSRRGLPGLIAGLGLPLLYVAFLNRDGPGTVCSATSNALGVGQNCAQQGNPWLWLIGALVLIAAGIATFLIASRSRPESHCSTCGYASGRDAQFCGHCGSPVQLFSESL